MKNLGPWIGNVKRVRMARLPLPAETDDPNHWVNGRCWLAWCGSSSGLTRVAWIGRATVAGATAPVFACGPCIRRLGTQVLHEVTKNLGGPDTADPYGHQMHSYAADGAAPEHLIPVPARPPGALGPGP